jgi:hypothetical protein
MGDIRERVDTFFSYSPARQITTAGTVARLIVGVVFIGIVVVRAAIEGFSPGAWVLGLLGFPVLLLTWQWLRARVNPRPFIAIGPVPHVLNVVVFFVLFLTPWYFDPLSVTSDAALLFYGASMLLAAARGYAGCEVLAVSNWLLRRDDQIGCLLFAPVDMLSEKR